MIRAFSPPGRTGLLGRLAPRPATGRRDSANDAAVDALAPAAVSRKGDGMAPMFSDRPLRCLDDVLMFRVPVDGRMRVASLPLVTLTRRFGAEVSDQSSWLRAYRQHAARINRVAIQRGRRADTGDVIALQDDDFLANA